MADLKTILDTSDVSLNEWASYAIERDRKRLSGLILLSAPPDVNEAHVKVQQGRIYDQFEYEITYGQRIGDHYFPAEKTIRKTTRELVPLE